MRDLESWTHPEFLMSRVLAIPAENPRLRFNDSPPPPNLKPLESKVYDVFVIISRYLEHNAYKARAAHEPMLARLLDNIDLIWQSCRMENAELEKVRDNAVHVVSSFQKIGCALKVQAAFRGRQVRRRAVSSRQIVSFLKRHLLPQSVDGVPVEDIARGLCREIEEVFSQPNAPHGRIFRVHSTKTYLWPDWFNLQGRKTPKREFQLKFDCRLEPAGDGKSIQILIAPVKDRQLGYGAFKIIHKAQRFVIPLATCFDPSKSFSTPRAVDCLNRVVHELHKDVVGWRKRQFLRAAEKHEALFKKIGNDEKKIVRMTAPPTGAVPTADDLPKDFCLTYPDQEWYNSDFHGACVWGSIPPDMHPGSPREPFSMENSLDVLIDVSHTLVAIHQEGSVHRDVKPQNIFIKLEGGTPRGYIGDFDLIESPGLSSVAGRYFPWDFNSECGWVTPFCDCYGLAMSLGVAMIPGFRERIMMRDHSRANVPAYISHAVDAFIRQGVPPLLKEIDFGFTNSAARVGTLIDAYLEQNTKLDPKQRAPLVRYKNQVYAVEKSACLIREISEQDKIVWERLTRQFERECLIPLILKVQAANVLELKLEQGLETTENPDLRRVLSERLERHRAELVSNRTLLNQHFHRINGSFVSHEYSMERMREELQQIRGMLD